MVARMCQMTETKREDQTETEPDKESECKGSEDDAGKWNKKMKEKMKLPVEQCVRCKK